MIDKLDFLNVSSNSDITDDLVNEILTCEIKDIDEDTPTARFRGSIVLCNNNERILIGWQRNITKIRSEIVSLPTVVIVKLKLNGQVYSAKLHKSFRGSKGVLCNYEHVDKRLQKFLTGKVIDENILEECSVQRFSCFHIDEVLKGLFSFYLAKDNNDTGIEQEIVSGFLTESDFIIKGIHRMEDKEYIYKFEAKDVLDKISYDRDGFFIDITDCEANLYLNGKRMLSKVISISFERKSFLAFNKLLVKFINMVKNAMMIKSQAEFLNSNLYPPAFAGLFIQGLAVNIFKAKVANIYKALDLIQRNNGVPVCIGGRKDEEEAFITLEYPLSSLLRKHDLSYRVNKSGLNGSN